MFQLVLPLHECADPAAAESTAIKFAAKFAATEFAAEPLQSVADSAAVGATPTETS
jgi:hypothetical protein